MGPFLGQPVIYQRPAAPHRPAALVAAIVTRRNDRGTYELAVMAPGAPLEHVEAVPFHLVSAA